MTSLSKGGNNCVAAESAVEDTKEYLYEKHMAQNFLIVSEIRKGTKTIWDLTEANKGLLFWSLNHKVAWERFQFIEREDAQNTILLAYAQRLSAVIQSGTKFTEDVFGRLILDAVSDTKKELAETYFDAGIKMSYSTQKRHIKEGKELPKAVDGTCQDVEVVESPESIYLRKERKDEIRTGVAELSELEAKVISATVLQGKTRKAAGEALGIPTTRVRYVENRAIEKLAAFAARF